MPLLLVASRAAEADIPFRRPRAKQVQLRRRFELLELFPFGPMAGGPADVAFGGQLALLQVTQDDFGSFQHGFGHTRQAGHCSQSGERLTVAALLGPYFVNRDCTSAVLRPAGVVASRTRSRAAGSFQTSSGPSSPFAGFMAPSRCDPLTSPRSRAASIDCRSRGCRSSLDE